MNMNTTSKVQVAEAVECELARLRAARPHPYPRIERVENILVADLACIVTSDA
jgi:hypothetical protein